MKSVRFFFSVLWACSSICCAVGALSSNAGISKAIEQAITSDEFVISVKNVLPNSKWKREPETIFSLELPASGGNNQRLTLLLDKEKRQLIANYKLHTVSENRTFVLSNGTDDALLKTLLVHVKQQANAAGYVALYVNCMHYTTIKSAKTLRDLFLGMRNPQLSFWHDRKYEVSVDSDLSIDDVLLQNNCPTEIQNSDPLARPNSSGRLQHMNMGKQHFLTTTLRSDLPPPSECDFNSDCCTVKINYLIDQLTKLQQEMANQRTDIQELRKALNQCIPCTSLTVGKIPS